MDNTEKKVELQIIAPEKVQSPVFANIAQINVTDREVVIDFAFVQPNTSQGILVAKVVLTPDHAKILATTLSVTIEKHYEQTKNK